MVGTEGGSGRGIVGEERCVVDRAGRAEVGQMCGRRVLFLLGTDLDSFMC